MTVWDAGGTAGFDTGATDMGDLMGVGGMTGFEDMEGIMGLDDTCTGVVDIG